MKPSLRRYEPEPGRTHRVVKVGSRLRLVRIVWDEGQGDPVFEPFPYGFPFTTCPCGCGALELQGGQA